MNGIQMLKKDHREVETMFKKFERGKENSAGKLKIVRDLVRELSKHSAVEEEIVYPLVRRRISKLEPDVLKSLEEHHLVKVTLAELQHLKPTDERFEAKVRVLMDEVRNHIAEEEEEVLPALERLLNEREVANLGSAIERAKKVAPTRPHPMAPDTPPKNVIAGVGAALVDRARDAGRDMIGRATHRGNGHRRTTTTTRVPSSSSSSSRRNGRAGSHRSTTHRPSAR